MYPSQFQVPSAMSILGSQSRLQRGPYIHTSAEDWLAHMSIGSHCQSWCDWSNIVQWSVSMSAKLTASSCFLAAPTRSTDRTSRSSTVPNICTYYTYVHTVFTSSILNKVHCSGGFSHECDLRGMWTIRRLTGLTVTGIRVERERDESDSTLRIIIICFDWRVKFCEKRLPPGWFPSGVFSHLNFDGQMSFASAILEVGEDRIVCIAIVNLKLLPFMYGEILNPHTKIYHPMNEDWVSVLDEVIRKLLKLFPYIIFMTLKKIWNKSNK